MVLDNGRKMFQFCKVMNLLAEWKAIEMKVGRRLCFLEGERRVMDNKLKTRS